MNTMHNTSPEDNATTVININELIANIKQEQLLKENSKNSTTIFKSEGMRIVLIALGNGTELKTHSAAGVISVHVLEGKIQFSTAQQSIALETGQILALQKGVPHSVIANMETIFLLTLAV